MRRVMVSLDAGSLERARKLGGGNVSAGIRLALKPDEIPGTDLGPPNTTAGGLADVSEV